MIARLLVGLADEGVSTTLAVPANRVDPAWFGGLVRTVTYESSGLPLSRRFDVLQLLAAVTGSSDPSGQPPGAEQIDVVHALGGSAWGLAQAVAREVGAALALEVWRAGLVARAATLRASSADRVPTLLLAPGAAIERLLAREAPGLDCRAVPWGVHVPSEPIRLPGAGEVLGVVIAGSGQHAGDYAAALEGLADVMRDRPDVIVFIDADAAHRAGVWGVARRLALLDRLTLVSELEGRRELALRAHVLVLPEAVGEHRTLTLDAMAAGMAVVGLPDPNVEVLGSGSPVRLVEKPAARAWSGALSEVLGDASRLRALGEQAREHVRRHHRASAQVAGILDAYERLKGHGALPFHPSRGRPG